MRLIVQALVGTLDDGTPLPVTRFSPVQTSHIWWLRK